jgi:hypothetical protein
MTVTGPYRTQDKPKAEQRVSNYLNVAGTMLLVTEKQRFQMYKVDEFASISWKKLELPDEADFGGTLDIWLKSGASFSHTFIWDNPTPDEYRLLKIELGEILSLVMKAPAFIDDVIAGRRII